jgi:3',5'-cyclic AMP phosphodiesterase CpdA
MRLIAHISDLHFGYNDPLLANALSKSLVQISPNVLVVSGDLVEHATDAEFQNARDFLDSLPGLRSSSPATMTCRSTISGGVSPRASTSTADISPMTFSRPSLMVSLPSSAPTAPICIQ